MTQRSETGRGRLSSLFWLAVFVALGYAAWHVGPVYYANYMLNDKLEEIARTPRGGHVDEIIAKGIRDSLRETELQEYLRPTDFKIAVILCDVEEFSYEEIAQIMGCPIGTVMSRLHRGRKLLQRSLYNHALALGIVKGEPMPETAAHLSAIEKPADLAAFRTKKRGAA